MSGLAGEPERGELKIRARRSRKWMPCGGFDRTVPGLVLNVPNIPSIFFVRGILLPVSHAVSGKKTKINLKTHGKMC